MAQPQATPVLNDIVQFEPFMFDVFGHNALNRLRYKVTAVGVTPPTYQSLANTFLLAWQPSIQPLLENTVECNRIAVKRLWPLPQSLTYFSTAVGVFGTGGVGMLPPQTCGLIEKLTAMPGRKFRGRMFLPFPPTAAQVAAGAVPTVAYQNNAAALANIFLAPITFGGGPSLVTLSPVVASVHLKPTPVELDTLIVGFLVAAEWATQRRRGLFKVAHR